MKRNWFTFLTRETCSWKDIYRLKSSERKPPLSNHRRTWCNAVCFTWKTTLTAGRELTNTKISQVLMLSWCQVTLRNHLNQLRLMWSDISCLSQWKLKSECFLWASFLMSTSHIWTFFTCLHLQCRALLQGWTSALHWLLASHKMIKKLLYLFLKLNKALLLHTLQSYFHFTFQLGHRGLQMLPTQAPQRESFKFLCPKLRSSLALEVETENRSLRPMKIPVSYPEQSAGLSQDIPDYNKGFCVSFFATVNNRHYATKNANMIHFHPTLGQSM